jgi:hypothetical protein
MSIGYYGLSDIYGNVAVVGEPAVQRPEYYPKSLGIEK